MKVEVGTGSDKRGEETAISGTQTQVLSNQSILNVTRQLSKAVAPCLTVFSWCHTLIAMFLMLYVCFNINNSARDIKHI